MSSEIKLNFNHPWGEVLHAYAIPKSKWNEFYDKFGYEFGNWKSKEEMEKAWVWILQNSLKKEKVMLKAGDD